jgi:hypothetical protein
MEIKQKIYLSNLYLEHQKQQRQQHQDDEEQRLQDFKKIN